MKGIETMGKGGAALVTAIVFVFFLTLFGLAFYRLGETDIDLFGYQRNLSRALYASEAGIDKVRWMIRESQQITGANANPFSDTYVEANAFSIANPTSGDYFFPGVADAPYFKVSMIEAVGSDVRVQVLGSVDVDADGVAGLTPIGDGRYDPDPDDVNRTFNAYIGLPGTLGERIGGKGISSGAMAFYDPIAGIEVILNPDPRSFVTPDGDSMAGFRYSGGPTDFGIWDQWGFIFSNPVKTGDIELPRGIFDADGNYIDEDYDTIPDYFQDLDRIDYGSTQTFTPSNDPTAGADGRRVIYVNGNITIDGVDFGYLDDQGVVRNCDWQGTDLAFIANGDITVDRVDCGNMGRLVLVGNNIILKGDYNTKVNGIAIAYNDITLDGSGCANGILTHQTDYSRPVKYTAYFLGTMVAGNRINLLNDGWTIIYDDNVINGNMYSTTISKPTLTYERVEAGNFNTSNNWRSTESTPELLHTQGRYTQEERDTMQGDYADLGDDNDNVPEVMRVYTDRINWVPRNGPRAIGETLRLYFPSGNFIDPNIPDFSQQNWDYYDTITFWIALDNFVRPSTDGTRVTRRDARYDIILRDSDNNTISIPLLNLYPESEWGTVRYHHTGIPEEYMNDIRDLTAGEKANGETYSTWKRVKITPNNINPGDIFDFGNVTEFGIRYLDFNLSWTVDVGKPDVRVDWTGSYFLFTDEDGNSQIIEGKDMLGDLNNDPPAPSDGYNYLYDYNPSTGIYTWFRWYEDPNSSIDVRMREEILMPTLRIDRLELPGKPATNNFLEYGFPHSLRLEVTNWREL